MKNNDILDKLSYMSSSNVVIYWTIVSERVCVCVCLICERACCYVCVCVYVCVFREGFHV